MKKNKEKYTPDKMHPEDAIYKAKTFIRELEKVQSLYFEKLVSDLNLNSEGEQWLFDYVYNSEDEYDGFDHYLDNHNKNYNNMFISDITNINDYSSPVDHMSSCEASLGTTFPSPFDNEEVSIELKTLTETIKNNE
jgi:hypothetical protein